MSNIDSILQGVSVLGPLNNQTRKILNKNATAFLAVLHRSFNVKRKELLQRRVLRQAELDKGILPDFLLETRHVRENDAWKGAPPAPGLVDRRIEITGPTDRKMVVNALNSNVWTYMADFEGKIFTLETSAGNTDRVLGRLERPDVGQYGQWTSKSVRCYPEAGRFQARR